MRLVFQFKSLRLAPLLLMSKRLLLKQLIRETGLTRKAVADRMEISTRSLYYLISNPERLRIDQAGVMARVLGMEIEDFVKLIA